MTVDMYRRYFEDYQNDPDLLLPAQPYIPYAYSEEKAVRYAQKQTEANRIPLAIICNGEIVGEIILKNIEERKCATMSISLKNPEYKDRGIGTAAERLAVHYVFYDLDIPTLYADTIQTNTRSQHVLEKAGFTLMREDKNYKYYRLDKETAL